MKVPAPLFIVPPPPPPISRPVPPIQPAPEPIVPAEISTSIPPPQSLPSPLLPRSPEERPDSLIEEEPGPPPLPLGRPSGIPPPPPIVPRPTPSHSRAETLESRATRASHESEEYEEDPSAMSFDLPRYTNITSQSQDKTNHPDPPEQEILADEDGGRLFSPSNLMHNSLPTRRSHRSRFHPSKIPLDQNSEATCRISQASARGAHPGIRAWGRGRGTSS